LVPRWVALCCLDELVGEEPGTDGGLRLAKQRGAMELGPTPRAELIEVAGGLQHSQGGGKGQAEGCPYQQCTPWGPGLSAKLHLGGVTRCACWTRLLAQHCLQQMLTTKHELLQKT
jgi:hypothetical protein